MMESGEAMQRALGHLIQLVGPRELADVNGVQLEELELTDDSKYWNVTLSYPIKKVSEVEASPSQPLPESLAKFLKDSPRRKWRTFKIDAEDGRLIAMKVPATTSAN